MVSFCYDTPQCNFYSVTTLMDLSIVLTLSGQGFLPTYKHLGGGHFAPPPNLAISSQMTMKLGKGILWIKIFTS